MKHHVDSTRHPGQAEALWRELCAARRRIAGLEAALRPFAEYADGYAGCWRDHSTDDHPVRGTLSVQMSGGKWYPTLGDCRRAAEALAAKKG